MCVQGMFDEHCGKLRVPLNFVGNANVANALDSIRSIMLCGYIEHALSVNACFLVNCVKDQCFQPV